MRIAVILPAAGRSRRFGGGAASKLEADLAGRAVLLRSVELFTGRAEVRQIIVAADPERLDEFRFKWSDRLNLLGVKIVAGGRTERWETVSNGLAAVEENITHIAVHDAARPVTDPRMIDQVIEAAKHHPAVIPAVPVHATLKRIEGEPAAAPETESDPLDAILGSAGRTTVEARRVIETVPRDRLWMAQTPQVFDRALLERAYSRISGGAVKTDTITDDAGLIEAMGEPVAAVTGDSMNVKITVEEDLSFAAAVLIQRSGKPAADTLGSKRRFPTWAESEDD